MRSTPMGSAWLSAASTDLDIVGPHLSRWCRCWGRIEAVAVVPAFEGPLHAGGQPECDPLADRIGELADQAVALAEEMKG